MRGDGGGAVEVVGMSMPTGVNRTGCRKSEAPSGTSRIGCACWVGYGIAYSIPKVVNRTTIYI